MKTVILDGLNIFDMEDVHDTFSAALDFPAWYGRNLDALYDMLSNPHGEVTVILRHTELLSSALGKRWMGLVRVLQDASDSGLIHIEVEEA